MPNPNIGGQVESVVSHLPEDTPLEDLEKHGITELDRRTLNALINGGITTVRQLLAAPELDLLKLKNMGDKAMSQAMALRSRITAVPSIPTSLQGCGTLLAAARSYFAKLDEARHSQRKGGNMALDGGRMQELQDAEAVLRRAVDAAS
jgi:hypothetical protein